MGKYFSNTSDFSKYDVTDDNSVDTSTVIPSTDNLTNKLSDETKEKLSKTPNDATNEDEYINLVKEQTDQVSSMIKKYSDESKQELKNQFKKFQPIEIFEKLNQIIFVIAELSNRINSLEKTIKGNSEEKEEQKKISDPSELYAIQQHQELENKINIPENIPESKEEKLPNIEEIKKKINEAKSGKIPNDDYKDNSINLEEVFPDLDDEAYQAAYASSSEKEKTKTKTKEKTPTPGKMRRGLAGL